MFKRLMYNKVIEVLNLNTQKVYSQIQKQETNLTFEGGYLLGLYPNGIPYAVKQLDTTTKYSYDNVEVIPVSEELSQETPSVNKSDRSDYVFRYQVMFRVDLKDVVETALDEFRDYFFTNKQFTLDGYTVAVKTTRGDKLPTTVIDGGQFYNYYAFTIYATAIENGYIRKDTDTWSMQLDSEFGTSTVATSFVVGKAYEITTVGTTDWNEVFGTEDITYSVGDSGLCEVVGTGTGVGKITYQELNILNDTFSTIGNPIFTNKAEVGKGFVTTTTSTGSLNIQYDGTNVENKIYEWGMNKLDKDTIFKVRHTFNGTHYTYDAYLVECARTLDFNAPTILKIKWIEADE